MESLVVLMASVVTVVPPLVVLAIVFRIAKEMKEGMFKRFFRALELAFLLITAQALVMPLALNGIAPLALPVFTSLASYVLLALAFVLLYTDWGREPVAGLDS
jgi:chromate transport protein ChrA